MYMYAAIQQMQQDKVEYIIKLYVPLEFCETYSLLSFLSLLGSHNTLVEGYTSYFE